jgi:hypothetical protein
LLVSPHSAADYQGRNEAAGFDKFHSKAAQKAESARGTNVKIAISGGDIQAWGMFFKLQRNETLL